jgi:hypothetical protein
VIDNSSMTTVRSTVAPFPKVPSSTNAGDLRKPRTGISWAQVQVPKKEGTHEHGHCRHCASGSGSH